MIMEPMADATATIREREERQKFKAGLKKRGSAITGKRGREDDDQPDHFLGREGNALVQSVLSTAATADAPPAKKKRKGPKEPNPLSIKKAKPRGEPKTAPTTEPPTEEALERQARKAKRDAEKWEARMARREKAAPVSVEEAVDGTAKRKRKHKPKPKTESADAAVSAED
jgi:U3 small nucleolar RNA-associated protein 23